MSKILLALVAIVSSGAATLALAAPAGAITGDFVDDDEHPYVVLMMAVENAPLIAEVLLRGGRPASTPVAIVCDGTMPTERTVLCTLGTLGGTIAEEAVRPPAVIVIGEVVAVAKPEQFARAADG